MSSSVVIYLTDTRLIAARMRGAASGPASGTGSGATIAERRCAALDEPLDACTEFSVGAVSEVLSDVVRGMTSRSTTGTLVIPARWCYVHPVELRRRRFSTQAAAYELEEYLPLPLEQVTCGFVRNEDGTALGVAVPTLPIHVLVKILAEVNIHVHRVLVDVFCAALAVSENRTAPHGVLLTDVHHRTFALIDGRDACPVVLRNVFGHKDGNSRSLLLQQTAVAEQACGLSTEYWRVFDLGRDADCDTILLSAHRMKSPAPDLCTGQLSPQGADRVIRRRLSRAAMAAIVFLASLAVSLHVQRQQYDRAIAGIRAEQHDLYRDVFANTAVPPSPALVIASERKRLEGVTLQTGADRPNTPVGKPADRLKPLSLLRHTANALPAELRINLLTLTIDEQVMTLRGQTRDHRDAERIVESIHTTPGLIPGAPRTSRLSGGAVEFSVRSSIEAFLNDPGGQDDARTTDH